MSIVSMIIQQLILLENVNKQQSTEKLSPGAKYFNPSLSQSSTWKSFSQDYWFRRDRESNSGAYE
jgi:hypothetical protein